MTKKRRILLIIFIILTLSVMAAIFFFSSQNAASSTRTSGSVVRFILSVVIPGFEDMSPSEQAALVTEYGSFIRKCAHFTEFAALGFCFTTLLSLGDISHEYVRSMVFGVLYASSDELHQLFSDGRACSLRDVLIDSSGFATGLILSILISDIIRKRKA